MNENVKTAVFLGVALLVVLVAVFSGPRTAVESTVSLVGKPIIKDFEPTASANIEIVEFDEGTAEIKPFSVERKKIKDRVTWVIPSHQDYPTDAQNQLSEVATALMDLKVLEVKSDKISDHSLYGVLDPDLKARKVGDKGVGKRVTIKDAAGKTLAALIIGKPEGDNSELRYVRRVDDDRVCVVAMQVDKISTDFDKWIEKDLLKFRPMDLKQVRINDYSIEGGYLKARSRLTLDYSDMADPRWKMVAGETFDRETKKWLDEPLGDKEELDTAKLDGMKSALQDLKIVDVLRKPAGLSADLKAQGDVHNDDASLSDHGFLYANAGEGDQLYSSQGEVRVSMQDGVEYILRFGEITGGESKKSKADKKNGDKKNGDKDADDEKDKDGAKPAGKDRFLFVAANFNESLIERPKMLDEPKAADKPADAKEPEAAKPDADSGDKEKSADAAADKKDEPKTEKPADPAELQKIRDENKRRVDDYDDKVKRGREHAKELTDRFADWYYVIANDEFEKIHLSRADIVKAKQAKASAGDEHAGHDHADGDHADQDHEKSDVEKFDEVKDQGLRKPAEK